MGEDEGGLRDGLADWRERLSARVAVTARAAGAGVWEWDLASGAFRCDAATRRLLDLQPEAGLDISSLFRAVAAEDRRRLALEFDEAAAGRRGLDAEFQVTGAGAEPRWLRTQADLIGDGRGRPARLVGAIWDNSASQRMAEQAHDREERLRITLASIGEAVVTADAAGRVTYLNAAAEELTGWTSALAEGRELEAVLALSDIDSGAPLSPARDAVGDAAAPRGRSRTARLVSQRGQAHEVEYVASPILTRRGEAVGLVLVVRDVTERRRLERQLRHAATHDPLTGLANRRGLEEALQVALDEAQERGAEHALCYIDVDQFKIINDTAGHHAGDQFLRQVSGLFRAAMRPGDELARIGGDEFALIMRDTPLAQAAERARALVEDAGAFRFPWGQRAFTAGVSIGVCAVAADLTVVELLSQADVACYSAKAAGRGRISIYHREDAAVAARHREISVAATLREAIRENRFVLHGQEIVARKAGEHPYRHFELLVRMVGEDGALVSPGVFIPAAERFDLMVEIDRWVLREALARLAPQVAAAGDVHVSLNLSGNSLNHPGFLEEMVELVRASPLRGPGLTFELTETAAFNNMAAAGGLMDSLRAEGCRIALDDFGVGLSSFAYLKTFPVDCVKIDGSFIRHIGQSSIDRAIVESMNALAHRLGAETVAEFVEDAATIAILEEIGVDYFQGYVFGPPKPFEALLAARREAGERLRA